LKSTSNLKQALRLARAQLRDTIMQNVTTTQGWHRTLMAMLAVQFVIGVSFSIVPPLLPLTLPGLGVTSTESVRMWAGLLIGVTPLAAALTSPLWGYLLHCIDPRLILLVSCLSAAVCTASMSLATSPWQLMGLRFTMGLFGGHIAASMSIVATITPTYRLGWSLGWLATAQLSGMLIGPLVGGAVADTFASLRAPFLLGGCATLMVCAVLAVVPPVSPAAATPASPTGTPAEPLLLYRRLATLAMVLLLAQCAIMGPQPIVPLRVHELLGAHRDVATLAGLAFSVVALSGLIAAPLIGRLSDAFGARRLLIGLLVCASLCTAAQAVADSYPAFVAARFCAGLFLCSIIPVTNSLVGHSVPRSARGRAYGLTSGAAFMGAFLGPLGSGLLAAYWGLNSVFMAGSVLLLINAALMSSRKRTVIHS
jgi:DHA1 family multidrug resistance protein-like MFS transporter